MCTTLRFLILIDLLITLILRDFHEIIAEILVCVQVGQGITKTRVMYEVQLSYTRSKEYLQYLQISELISYDEQERVF
jgi:predicted transcriptional regulator